jgi:hypothetical protein
MPGEAILESTPSHAFLVGPVRPVGWLFSWLVGGALAGMRARLLGRTDQDGTHCHCHGGASTHPCGRASGEHGAAARATGRASVPRREASNVLAGKPRTGARRPNPLSLTAVVLSIREQGKPRLAAQAERAVGLRAIRLFCRGEPEDRTTGYAVIPVNAPPLTRSTPRVDRARTLASL